MPPKTSRAPHRDLDAAARQIADDVLALVRSALDEAAPGLVGIERSPGVPERDPNVVAAAIAVLARDQIDERIQALQAAAVRRAVYSTATDHLGLRFDQPRGIKKTYEAVGELSGRAGTTVRFLAVGHPSARKDAQGQIVAADVAELRPELLVELPQIELPGKPR